MQTEATFFVIPPPKANQWRLIRNFLEDREEGEIRLSPRWITGIRFTSEMLFVVYPELETLPGVRDILLRELMDKGCITGVCRGHRSIESLVKLSGAEPDPRLCGGLATIRGTWGAKEPIVSGNEEFWLHNFYRPKNQEEVTLHAPLFGISTEQLYPPDE